MLSLSVIQEVVATPNVSLSLQTVFTHAGETSSANCTNFSALVVLDFKELSHFDADFKSAGWSILV